MPIKAIVYTSQTGYTKTYAEMLSKETGIPAMPLSEAVGALGKDDAVVYMGWLMAGNVKDVKKALGAFSVKAVIAVGLCETGSLTDKVREQNKLPSEIEVFTLQGGYSPEKLRGMNRFLMKIVTKALVKKIDNNENKTDSDYKMRKVLTVGGSLVKKENLADVAAYLHNLPR